MQGKGRIGMRGLGGRGKASGVEGCRVERRDAVVVWGRGGVVRVGKGRVAKRGGLVISSLAFSTRGHGFDPRGRLGKISVSEHAFFSVICRDDTK